MQHKPEYVLVDLRKNKNNKLDYFGRVFEVG